MMSANSRNYMVEFSSKIMVIMTTASFYVSRHSSVGTALGYGLYNLGSRVRFTAGLRIFLLSAASRTALLPTPASYPMGKRRSFPEGKTAGT
jgi:hypothetical protein